MGNKSILSMGGVLFLTIYVDQMFFENFIMNYIILYATYKFSNIKTKWYKLLASASIGSIYVIGSYIFDFYSKPLIIVKIALSVVMVCVAFDIFNIRTFFKAYLFFVGVTFFIGGAGFGLAFFTNTVVISEGGILYVDEFPIVMIAVGMAIALAIARWLFEFFKLEFNVEKLLYQIEIKVFERKILLTALFDSGHNTKDPISGTPVVIIEKEMLKELMPDETFEKICKNDFDIDEKWKKRVRFIPISTVSSENELIIGLKADECLIHMKSGEKVISKVIVAGCDRKLDKDGKYCALIGRDMMFDIQGEYVDMANRN